MLNLGGSTAADAFFSVLVSPSAAVAYTVSEHRPKSAIFGEEFQAVGWDGYRECSSSATLPRLLARKINSIVKKF